ncbi:hypothetical protein T4D_6844 [Trichinella pseudospiralis]|uniref:Secreted protein n=1 Tax=Trichinella pseudospiralis TaxID=6337 RepID=A0A0V1G1J5_TRIPS|nr:hypothetical protein T4D_6844 [Trichinella pseudospiralis]
MTLLCLLITLLMADQYEWAVDAHVNYEAQHQHRVSVALSFTSKIFYSCIHAIHAVQKTMIVPCSLIRFKSIKMLYISMRNSQSAF